MEQIMKTNNGDYLFRTKIRNLTIGDRILFKSHAMDFKSTDYALWYFDLVLTVTRKESRLLVLTDEVGNKHYFGDYFGNSENGIIYHNEEKFEDGIPYYLLANWNKYVYRHVARNDK